MSDLPVLPFDYRFERDDSRHVTRLLDGEREVGWVSNEAVRATDGLALWSFFDKVANIVGIAPVRLLPTHHKKVEEIEWGEPDWGYLWHLFMGRDPDTYRDNQVTN